MTPITDASLIILFENAIWRVFDLRQKIKDDPALYRQFYKEASENRDALRAEIVRRLKRASRK